MHSIWRTAVALVLSPWVALSSIAAPEHVHEADSHHATAVAHRHFAPHDHDASEVSHDEGRVLWLDDVAVQQAMYEFAVTLAVLTVGSDAIPDPISWVVRSTLDAAPPHGPPRATTSLRAPPCPA